jgi:DNA-binding NarL/FixJ family response regulator
MDPLTMVLADSYQMMREAVRLLLESRLGCQVVGEATTGPEALALVQERRPAILITDLSLPELNAIALIQAVRVQAPTTCVIVLAMVSDVRLAREAMQAGAMAYVLKQAPADELLQAISQVVAHQHYLSPRLADQVLRGFAQVEPVAIVPPARRLSQREREVLNLVTMGLTSAAIAGRLGIGVRTVEWHRARLLRKLELRSVAELVRYALQHELSAKESIGLRRLTP